MKKIPQILARTYLRRFPLAIRKSQFNFFSRLSWIKTPLEEIRDELFSEADSIDAEVTEPQSEATISKAKPKFNIIKRLGSDQISGQQRSYQIESYLGQRGNGHLLDCVDDASKQSVIVKYYQTLRQSLVQDKFSARQHQLRNVIRLSHPDNHPHEDLRVCWPIEVIESFQDDNYFIVTDHHTHGPSLKSWLKNQSTPLESKQVRRTIGQILQTLMHLHHRPIRLASGQLQAGLVHGNLTSESVVCVERSGDYFFYLCDLALWENLLYRDYGVTNDDDGLATGIPIHKTIQRDLAGLSQIGFELLQQQNAEQSNEVHLSKFLQQLSDNAFPNSEAAWQAWLKLPPLDTRVDSVAVPSEKSTEPKRKSRPWRLIAGTTLLAMLGVTGGWWWLRSRPDTTTALPCCIKQVDGVPEGEFTYGFIADGSWARVLKQKDLFAQGLSVHGVISDAHQSFLIEETAKSLGSIEDAIEQVAEEELDFAIIPWTDNLELPPDLGAEIIAYDGLAVFVPFSYDQRQDGLPKELNGKFSLDKVRHYYTQGSDGDSIELAPYLTTNQEAIQIFRNEILLDRQSDQPLLGNNEAGTTANMLRKMLSDFEKYQNGEDPKLAKQTKIPGLGFATLSEIFKQCSVYPLAISAGDHTAVQPIVFKGNRPISPETNLCEDKPFYQINVEDFKRDRYPLAYPIAVIYLRDNSRPTAGQKFAEMMQTTQAQQLLLEANLVPIIDAFELVTLQETAKVSELITDKANPNNKPKDGSKQTGTYILRRFTSGITLPGQSGDTGNHVLTPTVQTPSPDRLKAASQELLPNDPTEPEANDVTAVDLDSGSEELTVEIDSNGEEE